MIRERIKRAVQAFFIEPTTLTGPRISTTGINEGRGNQFTTSGDQRLQLQLRWRNAAQYGNIQIRTVTKFLTGWIAGNGAAIRADGDRENEFIDNFLEYNKLDEALLTRIVRNALLEAMSLVYLKWDEQAKCVILKLLKWEKWRYHIFTAKDDDQLIERIEFRDANGQTIRLSPENFVLINYDNSCGNLNQPVPPLADILTPAINADRALADYRDYNHLWGTLGMHFEAHDVASGEMLIRMLEAKESDGGWKIGDIMAAPAKSYFPEPSGAGTKSIENEITLQNKIISGATGVGIHLLGWASEMSNRATAVELQEGISAHTAEPRDITENAIYEIIEKSIAIHNRMLGETLDPDSVSVKISEVSREQIKSLVEVWIPLEQGGYISKEDVQERIPGIDPETVKDRLYSQNENEMRTGNPDTLQTEGDRWALKSA